MEHSYKYAVIRAIPNPRKGEVVNIGIAVFHQETVDTRLAPSLHKLLALEGSVNVDAIRELPTSLSQWTSRVDTIEEKYQAIRSFGIVTLSNLGMFRTSRTVSYEGQIDALMRTLVLPAPRDVTPVSTNRITTTLRDIFRKKDILGKDDDDIHRHLIVPNFPIDADENLYADFALKNGAYWFTETTDFRARSNGLLDNTRVASLAAIKLLKVKKRYSRSKVNTTVVYAASPSIDVTSQLSLLRDYAQELVDIQDRKALAKYTQRLFEASGSNREFATS
jgi:Protein of unknown function (DUF3037)